ncbi:thiol:disulfide interchange protein [Litchfieldella qijiaojingensis]|uniref:Thiol:disulfide interchange protein n=1 Tax=Litchfieldella qijiaojingensis TaxID=980347 RepID=A0ABQ2Z786_9GAMM|nr:TlpA disulfide reductase family protein [Halomonas qijiaojingensis]GGY03575.1 thiol:disulfide interchange protein [Halomonas qijiaojingensis]
MDAIAIGPVLISLPRLYAFVAALVLLLASLLLLGLPRQRHMHWFNTLLVVWLVGARLGHVLTHIETYAAAPLDILKFWQPGYHGLWGLLAAAIWTAWALRDHFLRLIGGLALVAGSSALWLVLMTLSPLGNDMPLRELPDLALEDLDGNHVNLQDLQGERVLINLWATWCPPCLREMPMLARASSRDDVTVVVANQGEDLMQVARYLDEQELEFRYSLLDPHQELMVLTGSPGLPTTLLFDTNGRLREHHAGELSQAQLNAWLDSP